MRSFLIMTLSVTLGGIGLGAQVLATKTKDATTASVVADGAITRVEITRGGQYSHVTLGTRATAIVDLGISPGGDVVVLSEVMGSSMVSIVGADGTLVEFPTFHPALSSDGRFLIFQRHYPRGSETATAFVLLDAENPGAAPADSPPFFPGDQNEHVLKSALQWVDLRTFAFLDLDLTTGSSWLVAGEVGGNGGIDRLERRQLDPSILVDSTKMDGDVPPAAAISLARITRLEGAGLNLRLLFPTDPVMRVHRLDIQVW